MRIYKKRYDNGQKVVYDYLWSDHTLPYTGVVEIDKETQTAVTIKPAEGEWSPERAAFYAQTTLVRNKYPREYTHTAL